VNFTNVTYNREVLVQQEWFRGWLGYSYQNYQVVKFAPYRAARTQILDARQVSKSITLFN